MSNIKVTVQDANNVLLEVTPVPIQQIAISRGVAGRGIDDVQAIEIDNALYLEFFFTDGTTEIVGPVGTIQYIGESPIVVEASTISLDTVPISFGGTGAITASGARTNLGLGTIATQNANAVAITGGSITGITDLAVADGGTGASTAAGAMVNLLPSYTGNANKRLSLDSTASGLEWVTDGGGTVTSVDVSGGTTGLSFTGGPITTSGTITLSGTLDVDNGGTGATTAAGARTNLNAADQALTLTAGTGLSGGGDLTANRSFSIANTGVTAASYGAASKTLTATVNAQGQLTALADTPIAIANTQISGLGTMSTQNANAVEITGGSITGITDLAVADGGTGASTAADARTNLGAAASATTISAGTGLSGGGDLTANRTLSIANTAVTAGSYGTASDTLTATVNAQGQLTALAATPIAISNTQISGLGTMSTQNSNSVTITGGSITGITDLAIADGGTGASNAADARSNLGLGTAAVLNAGVANGVATLDAGGTVPLSQIPASIQGGVSYQGAWNASTNTPTLTSSVGTKGHYYVVSVAGNTNLNGVTDWLVGDWAIYNGTAWEKIDNTDQVASVNGYTGVVVLTNTDVGAPPTSLTISAGTGLSGGGDLTTNRTFSIANTAVSAGSYGTASAVPSFTVNGQGQLTAASDVTIAISNTQVSGLGTMSTQNANSVAITGGSITGITDLAIADGGTGASNAADARANLGVTATGGDTTYLFRANNLSDLANAATARTNLGLGTAATQDSTAFATAAQGAKADTAIQTITSTDGSIVVTPAGTTINLAVSEASPASTLLTAVRNTTGATLTKGTVVYISGATGQIATVSKAIATGDATSAQTLGMITSDLANNSNGYVTVFGLLENIDTSSYTDGAQLYLSGTTAGAVTATKPSAPTHLVYVAVVEYAHPTQGKLLVKVQNGYELDEIHDVSIVSPTTGQTLVYNATTDLWVNNTVSLTAGVNGTLPIANGGTGQTTANAAFNALAPSQTGNSGKYLTTDGTNTSWAVNAGGDVVGPASSTNNGIALFDGTTGKLLKDSASTDGLIYGITVGRGAGAVATNTAVGVSALAANTTGSQNVAFGYEALKVATASNNSAFGTQTLFSNTTGTFNTGIGLNALAFNTTGLSNTGIGDRPLFSNTTGSYNTAVGGLALQLNTTASNNTAVGYQAAYLNTTGPYNTQIGMYAGYYNQTGEGNTSLGYSSGGGGGLGGSASYNTSIGMQALNQNTTASNNTAVGFQAGYSNTTGTNNNFSGFQSGFWNTTGSQNTAFGVGSYASATTTATGSNNSSFGYQALYSNTTASNNTAVGYQAGYSNTTGNVTAIGHKALYSNTTGGGNVAVGGEQPGVQSAALQANTTGIRNTAMGVGSLTSNTTGNENAAYGFNSMALNTTGTYNAAFGNFALLVNSTGSYNTSHGAYALYNNTTASNSTAVGYQSLYANTTGEGLTAIGKWALKSNTTSNFSTAIGYNAMAGNTTGSGTAVGTDALALNTTGFANVAVGGYDAVTGVYAALYANTTGAYNTALGSGALRFNTTADNNTAVGYRAGYSNTTGTLNSYLSAYAGYSNTVGINNTYGGLGAGYYALGSHNVALGYGAFSYNSGGANGSFNTAIGNLALTYNTTGASNTAVGYTALYNNSTGAPNTAIGRASLYTNTTGSFNVAVGGTDGVINATLGVNTTGRYNTATGYGALGSNTTADYNTAVGYQAAYSNTTGQTIDAFGYAALYSNTTGSLNSALGAASLYANTTGSYNTAVGREALRYNTTASSNTAVGYQALYSNTVSASQTALGYQALYSLTGIYNGGNTALGQGAGFSQTSGYSNTYVGYNSGYSMTSGIKNTILGAYSGNQGGLDIRTASNYIVLSDGDGNPRGIFDGSGNLLIGTTSVLGTSPKLNVLFDGEYVWGQTIETSRSYGTHLAIRNTNGLVGSISSSGSTTSYNTSSDYRLKNTIAPMTGALAKVALLKPCTYKWNADGSDGEGFIAHELAEVVPQCVTGDKDAVDAEGNPKYQGIDTSFLVATLTAAIQEQQAIIESLKARLDAANL